NESVAASLVANGISTFSRSIKLDRARGFFCGIGKCSSCLMRINGVPNVRTCITPVRENIRVETQHGLADIPSAEFKKKRKESIDVDVLIIGGGPAGLTAALECAKRGVNVLIVDENYRLGGQLIKQTHKFFGSKDELASIRGIDIAKMLEEEIGNYNNIKVMLQSTVFGYYESNDSSHLFGVAERLDDYSERLIEVRCKSAVFACGAMENMIVFPNNDLPGVYGAGAVQTLVNVYGVKPGNRVLMVGSGNVGLIVSYQLLQAGIDVACVIEAMPRIGGYHVHAAKLRRFGVPILVSHTIKEAIGEERVEGATIVELNEKWEMIPGSEKRIDCDTICLAVGLTPSVRLVAQTGAHVRYIPEAGGYVAIHNEFMETSVKGIFTAGDLSGIEEASTAMLEGKIAGIAAACHAKGERIDEDEVRRYSERLKELRAGPFGEKARKAKERILRIYGERA
ncbi:MAG TPA: FAD-dependent oxidoreductase, partial [Thermoplasmatales archaeon]|nr:FAD-dependent oxidoreductase [Thermoplasmatales archaeon]